MGDYGFRNVLFVSILTLTHASSQSPLLILTHPHIPHSWGPKWGQNGYFMLVRGKGKCGIDTGVTSAVLG